METDEEGFWYPVVNEELCVHCGMCRRACPIINRPEHYPLEETYGAFATDIKEQMTSSSGGVFAVLAREILTRDGVVCGAAYAEDLSVSHIIISDENELNRIKGSKYVQSNTGDCFSIIKQYLKQGKIVLFSGTPCQVAGLKAYLGKDYKELICIDLICHGVPSPLVWKEYLKEHSVEAPIESIDFRYKNDDGGFIRIAQNGQFKYEKSSENLYMKGFISNLYVRPSCFACEFNGLNRCSDITIGDFWGVEEYHKGWSNGRGTSAVIVHSEKGREWLRAVSGQLNLISVPKKELELWNESLIRSTKQNANRKSFYEIWAEHGVDIAVDQLTAVKKAKPWNLQVYVRMLKQKFRG
jgi:coenzyme F420-reducing hydrogenase beta subunit